jgi:hypothetical protein
MDLDRCPRCGGEWDGGDICPNCQFVPIGVGLNKPEKGRTAKKKKKYKRYVEPGSANGLLSIVLFGLLGFSAYKYQPWQDDWEMVRSLFGQGRHHSIVGEWEVVKTLAVSKQDRIIARQNVQKGSFNFSRDGGVKIELLNEESQTSAAGTYLVDGTQIALRGLQVTGETSDAIPQNVSFNLAWTSSDDVVAMDKTEAIFLHRRKAKGALATFMQVDLKEGEKLDPGKAASSETRGSLGDIKRLASQEESEAKGN